MMIKLIQLIERIYKYYTRVRHHSRFGWCRGNLIFERNEGKLGVYCERCHYKSNGI